MKLPTASSPVQTRQTKQQFAKPDGYLDYELGKAVQELPPFYTRLVAGSLSLVVFGAIAWAALSKVDEVAVAPGKVLPPGEQEEQPVRSLSSGTIKYINEVKLREGQQVRKGEILIALDSNAPQVDLETLENQAHLMRQDLQRATKAAEESHKADQKKAQKYERLGNNLQFARLKERKECPFFPGVYQENELYQ